MSSFRYLFILFFILLLTSSCSEQNKKSLAENVEVQLFGDYELKGDLLELEVAPGDNIFDGLSIPSTKEKGMADFLDFEIKFNANKEQRLKYYYKLYYQNADYKYREELNGDSLTYNPKAAENFYGSWEDPTEGFRFLGELSAGESISLIDSFRIIGNPRNEERYFSFSKPRNVDQPIIDSIKREILGTADWVAALKEKARASKLSFDEQVHLDALWVIENMGEQSGPAFNYDSLLQVYIAKVNSSPEWLKSIEQKAAESGREVQDQIAMDAAWQMKQDFPEKAKQKFNIRSRRNPRMGEYEFLLVIVSEEELKQIPAALQDISQIDPLHKNYLNPFFYFNGYHYIADNENAFIIQPQQRLKASIRMDGEKGIYVDPLKLRSPFISKEHFTEKVNFSDQNFRQADFEQYFHVINKDYELKNVPILANVISDNYTQQQFKENMAKFPIDQRKISHTQITDAPGRTVAYDEENDAILIKNPGNESVERAVKENVGVASRIGLSYGKWTAKIHFPKIINDSNVWNGLTCAFWLFSDAMSDWNFRDVCEDKGYLAKGAKKYSEDRSPRTAYSEIDIEIVKTSKHWPKTSYGGKEDYPIDTPQDNHNLMITTTNWDLACPDPPKFHQGLSPIEYEGKTFEPHRWDWWYQAATTKHEYPHDKTVGKDLFYQIEWKPTEIIWRIGESKDNLDVIGYINEDYTKIPNNQMIAIITQEFHYALWWPLAPFDQNNVPYPKDDIVGKVYYVEVE